MKNTALCFGILFFLLHSTAVFSQLEIIDDYLDFEKSSLDITILNNGETPVKIENIKVKYDWLKIGHEYILTSGGREKTIKPKAVLKVDIPSYGADISRVRKKTDITCLPHQRTRLIIGLNIDLGTPSDFYYFELSIQGIIEASNQQILNAEIRTLDDVVLRQANESTQIDVKKNRWWANSEYHFHDLADPLSQYYRKIRDKDSLQLFYDDLLNSNIYKHENIAVAAIRTLGLSERLPQVAELLSRTDSLKQLKLCINTLKSLRYDAMQILLVQKFQQSLNNNPVLIPTLALELGKLRVKEIRPQVLAELNKNAYSKEEYEELAIAYQLLSHSMNNEGLYKLIEHKLHWANSKEEKQQYQFSKLVQLALYTGDIALFAPLLEQSFQQQGVGDMVVKELYDHMILMKENKENRLYYPSLLDEDIHDYDNYGYLYTRHRTTINSNDTIYQNFRLDPLWHAKPMFYAKADTNWLAAMKDIYPLYYKNRPVHTRYLSLLFADRYNDEKEHLDTILVEAIQDTIYSNRILAAQLITKYNKQSFKKYFIENMTEPKGGYWKNTTEWAIYCSFLGEKCGVQFEHILNENINERNIPLLATLEYLKKDTSLAKDFKNIYPKILLNNPSKEVRKIAFESLSRIYRGKPGQLKPFIKIALQDSTLDVRQKAEPLLLSQNIKGLDKIALENVYDLARQDVSTYNIEGSLAYYIPYLGPKIYPTLNLILRDSLITEQTKEAYINSITTHIPIRDWGYFEAALVQLFDQTKSEKLKADILTFISETSDEVQLKELLVAALTSSSGQLSAHAIKIARNRKIKGLEDIVSESLQKTTSTQYVDEVDELIGYLGQSSENILLHIWKDTTIAINIKYKYIKAAADNKDIIDLSKFENVFEYFYSSENIIYSVFAVRKLLSIKENAEEILDIIDMSLKDKDFRMRHEALKYAVEHNISGLNNQVLELLLNGKRNEIELSISYLKDEATPYLLDIINTVEEESEMIMYLIGLGANFNVLDFIPYKQAIQKLHGQFPEAKTSIATVECLIYLQEDSLDKANELIIANPGILMTVLKLAYSIPVVDMTRPAQEAIVEDKKNNGSPLRQISMDYGARAWYYLFDKAFENAEKAATVALELDSTQTWVVTNLALGLLYQGKFEQAKKVYLTYKDQTYQGKLFKETFLKDFDDLERAGITHPDVARIKNLLWE